MLYRNPAGDTVLYIQRDFCVVCDLLGRQSSLNSAAVGLNHGDKTPFFCLGGKGSRIYDWAATGRDRADFRVIRRAAFINRYGDSFSQVLTYTIFFRIRIDYNLVSCSRMGHHRAAGRGCYTRLERHDIWTNGYWNKKTSCCRMNLRQEVIFMSRQYAELKLLSEEIFGWKKALYYFQ